MTDVYYVKRGRRYHAVSQYAPGLLDSLPYGSHLVVVKPGVRSISYRVDPDHAGVRAALREHRDEIIDAIRAATRAQPADDEYLAAYEAFRRSVGADALVWTRPSVAAIVDALEAACARAIGGAA